jgi:hypothetical protein
VAACRSGYVTRLEEVSADEPFTEAFGVRGAPALSPGLLALVMRLQYCEDLTDRQAPRWPCVPSTGIRARQGATVAAPGAEALAQCRQTAPPGRGGDRRHGTLYAPVRVMPRIERG